MEERTQSLKGEVFASNGVTTIPSTPTPGTTYRDTTYNPTEAGKGWPFATIVDSAQFNQFLWQVSGLLNSIEKYGIPLWSTSTDYPIGAISRDYANGVMYEALLASGPNNGGSKQPSLNNTYWKVYEITSGGTSVWESEWTSGDQANNVVTLNHNLGVAFARCTVAVLARVKQNISGDWQTTDIIDMPGDKTSAATVTTRGWVCFGVDNNTAKCAFSPNHSICGISKNGGSLGSTLQINDLDFKFVVSRK